MNELYCKLVLGKTKLNNRIDLFSVILALQLKFDLCLQLQGQIFSAKYFDYSELNRELDL